MTRPSRWTLPWTTLPLLGLLALLTLLSGPASAAEKQVRFQGRALEVPASWPVYRLDRHPRMCVRLDRRAVYLGAPSPQQNCPAQAMGRRRAILVEPRAAAVRRPLLPLARTSATTRARSGTIFTGLGFDLNGELPDAAGGARDQNVFADQQPSHG